MSYTIDLIIEELPFDEKEAWNRVESLREKYYGDEREKSPLFLELYKNITKVYPCLCSYADDDPAMDESPWADGPMINNFANEMGMLAIVYSKVDDVVPFVINEAKRLGITVVDGQDGKIHRPRSSEDIINPKKPWWRIW
jgi:hypothetical protein